MYASGTIFLTISALIYTIITIIVFSTKKKINKLENRLFKRLLLLSVLSMVTELLIVLTNNVLYIGTFIQKLFLVFIVLWLSRFMDYTFTITRFDSKKSDAENIKKYKGIYYIFLIVNVICSLLIMIAPISFNDVGTAKYTSGLSVNIVFLITAIYMMIMFILLICNLKTVKNKKCLPIIILLVLLVMTAIIQNFNPQILLTNAVFGLVISIMYHTIENTDLKLISELKLAKVEAEKANNAKSDFLSSMSHEIRTPLNAIIGSVEMLKEEKLSEEGIETLKDLSIASQGLLELGSGILNISQIESGNIEIVEKEYEPETTFVDLFTLLKTRLNDKKIEFMVDIDKTIPKVLIGDKNKLKEIITNLLTNAIKYTEEGQIEFIVKSKVEKNCCNLNIVVKDTGIGIKEEMLDKIFDKFSRDEGVMDSNVEGTGLGLAITKNLVELLDGTIDVDSVYGKGTIFTVNIKQKISDNENLSEKLDASSKEPEVIEETKVSNEDNIIKIETNEKKTPKILIVDDHEMNLKIEQRYLESFDLKPETCHSGEECVDRIKKGEIYDVIVLDDMMPGLSGLETMKILKNEYDYKMPIVVLTANATETERDKYLLQGFDDFASKPISKNDFYNFVKKYF